MGSTYVQGAAGPLFTIFRPTSQPSITSPTAINRTDGVGLAPGGLAVGTAVAGEGMAGIGVAGERPGLGAGSSAVGAAAGLGAGVRPCVGADAPVASCREVG